MYLAKRPGYNHLGPQYIHSHRFMKWQFPKNTMHSINHHHHISVPFGQLVWCHCSFFSAETPCLSLAPASARAFSSWRRAHSWPPCKVCEVGKKNSAVPSALVSAYLEGKYQSKASNDDNVPSGQNTQGHHLVFAIVFLGWICDGPECTNRHT